MGINFSTVVSIELLWIGFVPLPRSTNALVLTEELYKKDLHDPENHNGVITDLEPDIMEYEVKWAFSL